MGVTVKPKERKPPWLHRLCTDGAGAMLHDVLCEGCGRYICQCRDGVWETWDPGVVSGDDLPVAIVLRRPLTRLVRHPDGQVSLRDVCGVQGLAPQGEYLRRTLLWAAAGQHTPIQAAQPQIQGRPDGMARHHLPVHAQQGFVGVRHGKDTHMSIDITGQALDSMETVDMPSAPAEAYVLGYRQGWDQALALAIQVEQAINNSDNLFSDRMPA